MNQALLMLLGLAMVCGAFAYANRTTVKALREALLDSSDIINDLLKQHEKERRDMLDRLMARDLPEVKQAQQMEGRTPGRIISKTQNDQRIIDENRKAAEAGRER